MTSKGRVVNSGRNWIGEYFLKDYLGNTRVVFLDYDGDLKINPDPMGTYMKQVVDGYYPFGLAHQSADEIINQPENQYLYNGKEKQDELSLGWYDYGARMYDTSIARWNVVDALAEEYYSFSPNNYKK
ncbi:MAG: RHS repeat-associated core domain-containing protein [Bacteroidota bacterium]